MIRRCSHCNCVLSDDYVDDRCPACREFMRRRLHMAKTVDHVAEAIVILCILYFSYMVWRTW